MVDDVSRMAYVPCCKPRIRMKGRGYTPQFSLENEVFSLVCFGVFFAHRLWCDNRAIEKEPQTPYLKSNSCSWKKRINTII